MGSYRVYKVGEDEHVRQAGADAPTPLEGGGREARGRTGAAAPRRWWLWALVAAAFIAAAVVYWFYGRDAVGNSMAAFDIAKLSGKVPDWAVLAAPVVMVAAIALVTVYLAFGRHLAVKLIGVAAVVVVLATPGLAVGYANGLVSAVGKTGTAARTAGDRAAISAADSKVDAPIPHKPMNILLIGSDKSTVPGDPGRSDTQLLVRLDPETKSISMLSLPRDLQVDIPGVGVNKMNAAYSYGGPALVIDTFKQLTGLPINGWIEVNFAGFWHVVNLLGGIYLPVDHKYFVPESADYKSIDLDAGYQLVRGKQALNYVRFRHDQRGDFTRMQRQQLFLRAVQQQSGRWSSDPTKVLKLIKAITGETKSSLSSLKKIAPLVQLAFEVNTSKVFQAHLEGATPMINGVSYVTATPTEIADVVHQFTNPTQAPVKTAGTKIGKKLFQVRVYNGSGIAGYATTAAVAAGGAGLQHHGRRRRPRVPGQGHRGLRAQEPPVTGQRHRRDDVAVGRAHRQAHAGHERRHQRVRGFFVRRHHRDPAGRHAAAADAAEEPEGRLDHVAAVRHRRRRSGWRLPRRGRRGSPTTSGATTPSRRPTAGTPPHRSQSSRRRSTGTGASRPCAGRTRRPSRTPTAHRSSTAASSCSSTRATICTWWPGRSTGRSTGCSTPSTTSSRTISCWVSRRRVNP